MKKARRGAVFFLHIYVDSQPCTDQMNGWSVGLRFWRISCMVIRRAWEMYPSLMEEGPASLATTASVLGPFGIPMLHLSTIRLRES